MRLPLLSRTLLCLLGTGLLLPGLCETVKDREGSVREDRAKMESDSRWIYNDVDAGFAQAKETGKPLLVVLRCVPCLACMGIDTGVLLENSELTPLMDQFVRVRLINANAIDLTRFQFDYDLSFSTLFFNPDGTVYGRYGSWEHQKDPENAALASFKVALERALRLHRGYPGNREALAGKQGRPMRFRRPVDMPGIKGKYREDLNWSGKVVQSCVHCHQIGDAQRLELRDKQREPLPLRLIYPHPGPATVGFTLDANQPTRVAAVTPGSPAAQAGLRAGDELWALSGQPLVSAADVSWVLHHLPDDGGGLEALIRRDGRQARLTLPVPAGWHEQADISRRVGTWPMRAMAFGGMRFVELEPAEREKLGLRDDQLGLRAKNVGKSGKHAAARRLGWKIGDILLTIDGSDARATESQLVGRLIRTHRPGVKVPATVLRDGKRRTLQIPIQ